jgi:general stress protein 26
MSGTTTSQQHQQQPEPRGEHIRRLAKLIDGIEIAMLTTVDRDGSLRSRPMATQKTEFDGDLWFFTHAGAPKVEETRADEHVNLSYASPSDNRYVSVSGTATLVRDRAKAEELWQPALKAWFPGGLDDPRLGLLRVHVEKAEYWDAPSGMLVQVAGFVKAAVTGQPSRPGENEKLTLDPYPEEAGRTGRRAEH